MLKYSGRDGTCHPSVGHPKTDALANCFPPGPNYDLAERALGIGLPPTVTYRVNSAARAGDTVQDPRGSSQSLLLYLKRSDLPEQIKLDKLNENEDTKTVPWKIRSRGFLKTSRSTIPHLRTAPNSSGEELVQAVRTQDTFGERNRC